MNDEFDPEINCTPSETEYRLSFCMVCEKSNDEISFSKTKNEKRKTIYRKNGNVNGQCGLHKKDIYEHPVQNNP